jgi:ABC-type Mn2+/Zn2+ transport system permease subunit
MTTAVSDLVLSVAMAAAAGLVGTLAVMRRMALASDAISHIALPGIGIAILLQANPTLGGLAALLLGALLVWTLQNRTRVPTEAIIGVVFSAALAVGAMLSTGEDLIDALFGAPGSPGMAEVALGIAGAIAVIVFVLRAEGRLVISLVSPDLARTSGIPVARLELSFLVAFALTVAVGLRFLGVLLMGSLIIIPAATAKHLARSLSQMRSISVGASVFSTAAGSLLAPRIGFEQGPLTIAIAAALFFAGLALRRSD